MSSLIAGAEAGFEPIPGYVLRERIGVGGYGEVWLVDAPGGLQKAIKFVFGSIDEDRAGNELRSLQRIRAVHHPFILSLERFEIVNGQLLVVTELADGSLLDRFRDYNQRGLVGIPRDRLLDYLRDSAEALDFLCQKHDLQHLDVKPANLLLVADRVKVADFGLIKDVQRHSMTLMGGMTPTYAAPEMFDGRPGRFSDQYSLAIVYQELLTGSLPFPGRTTAQLATEHLHKAPRMESLPPEERPIIGKALAKKPSQRFGSCREFVDALIQTQNAKVEFKSSQKSIEIRSVEKQQPLPYQNRIVGTGDKASGDSSQAETRNSRSWKPNSASPSTDKQEIKSLPPLTLENDSNDQASISVFIGVGGTGGEILTALRSRLQMSGLDLNRQSDLLWLQVDTNEQSLQKTTDAVTKGSLAYDQILLLPLKSSQQYREMQHHPFSPVSRRWLFNVPRSKQTEGVRPLAMIAYLDHANLCYEVIHSVLRKAIEANGESQKPIRIYLVGSMHGATGSVYSIEFAFLINQVLSELNGKAVVQAVLTAGVASDSLNNELATAASIACFREISHFYQTSGLYPGIPSLPEYHLSNAPWNNIYLVHGGLLGRSSGWVSAIEQSVDFLNIDACTRLGESLDRSRSESFQRLAEDPEAEWSPWLRTVSSQNLNLNNDVKPERFVQLQCLKSIQDYVLAFNSQSPSKLDLQSQDVGSNGSIKLRAQHQQIDIFVSDLFRENKWTAQSWVKYAMDELFPLNGGSDHEQLEVTSPTINWHDGEIESTLEQLEELGLTQVVEALGLSLARTQCQVSRMLDSAMNQLVVSLKQRWLRKHENWALLDHVIRSLLSRFESQRVSLKAVADRNSMQRDQVIEQLHNESADAMRRAELQQQIQSLDFQSSVHSIASHMLHCISRNLRSLAGLWKSTATILRDEMGLWAQSLAAQLNLTLDADGRLRDSGLPTPAAWFGIRESIQVSIDTAIQSMISERMFSAINPVAAEAEVVESDATIERNIDDLRLSRLIEVAMEAMKSAAENSGIDISNQDINGHEKLDFDCPSVRDQVRSQDCALLVDGGAQRKILLVPKGEWSQESLEQWKRRYCDNLTVVQMDGIPCAQLISEGEELVASSAENRLWNPNYDRVQLADRLQSRIDVEWLHTQTDAIE